MYVGHPGFMLQTDIKNKKIFNFWIKPFQAKHIPLIWAVNTFIGCLFWLHMDAVSCLLQQQNESLLSPGSRDKTDPYVEICSYSIDKTNTVNTECRWNCVIDSHSSAWWCSGTIDQLKMNDVTVLWNRAENN